MKIESAKKIENSHIKNIREQSSNLLAQTLIRRCWKNLLITAVDQAAIEKDFWFLNKCILFQVTVTLFLERTKVESSLSSTLSSEFHSFSLRSQIWADFCRVRNEINYNCIVHRIVASSIEVVAVLKHIRIWIKKIFRRNNSCAQYVPTDDGGVLEENWEMHQSELRNRSNQKSLISFIQFIHNCAELIV